MFCWCQEVKSMKNNQYNNTENSINISIGDREQDEWINN